jgi:hypothetical protein
MPESPDFRVVSLRRIGIDDVPFVLSLAYRRYRSFDPGKTLLWLAGILRAPRALAIRDDNAFLICHITTSPWHTPEEKECHIVFCCAAEGYHWQAVKLLKQSVQWARGQGCILWRFHSDTDCSVGALAKRAGADEAPPRYLIDLRAPVVAVYDMEDSLEDGR